MSDFLFKCAEQRAVVEAHEAETQAHVDGYLSGRQFALDEMFYYTTLAMRHCQACGARFWPFFSMSPRMQHRWRYDGVRYPECGGMSMEHKGKEMKHCHNCYVAMCESVKEKDSK